MDYYIQLQADKKIENYQFSLHSIVGKGSSGTVYIGKNQINNNLVAIKVIDNRSLYNDYTRNLLISEIQIMKSLEHPNIVKLLDVYSTANNTYIISEYCNSGDLRELMKKKGKFAEPIAIKIIKDILAGMKELTQHNIIHRDLKPANILIHDGVFKITDFGFAKKVDDIQDQLMKSLVGTPLYMSPQILQRGQYTSKCDIWSIGLIFYELLYGDTPWPAENLIELLTKVSTNPISFPLQPLVSDLTKHFIIKCLQHEEGDRFGWDDLFNHRLFNISDPQIQKIPKNILKQQQQQMQPTLQQQTKPEKDSKKQQFIVEPQVNPQTFFENNGQKIVQIVEPFNKIESPSKPQIITKYQDYSSEKQHIPTSGQKLKNEIKPKQNQNENIPSNFVEGDCQPVQQQAQQQQFQQQIIQQQIQYQLPYQAQAQQQQQIQKQIQQIQQQQQKPIPTQLTQQQNQQCLYYNQQQQQQGINQNEESKQKPIYAYSQEKPKIPKNLIEDCNNHQKNKSFMEFENYATTRTSPGQLETFIQNVENIDLKRYQTSSSMEEQSQTPIKEKYYEDQVQQYQKSLLKTYLREEFNNNERIINGQLRFFDYLKYIQKLQEFSITNNKDFSFLLREKIVFILQKHIFLHLHQLTSQLLEKNDSQPSYLNEWSAFKQSDIFQQLKNTLIQYYQQQCEEFNYYFEQTIQQKIFEQESQLDPIFGNIYNKNVEQSLSKFLQISQKLSRMFIQESNHKLNQIIKCNQREMIKNMQLQQQQLQLLQPEQQQIQIQQQLGIYFYPHPFNQENSLQIETLEKMLEYLELLKIQIKNQDLFPEIIKDREFPGQAIYNSDYYMKIRQKIYNLDIQK